MRTVELLTKTILYTNDVGDYIRFFTIKSFRQGGRSSLLGAIGCASIKFEDQWYRDGCDGKAFFPMFGTMLMNLAGAGLMRFPLINENSREEEIMSELSTIIERLPNSEEFFNVIHEMQPVLRLPIKTFMHHEKKLNSYLMRSRPN